MRALLAMRMSPDTLELLLGDEVFYRPELARKDSRFLRRALAATRPNVLLATAMPCPADLAEWRLLVPGEPLLALVRCPQGSGGTVVRVEMHSEVAVHHMIADPADDLSLFQHAERVYAREVARGARVAVRAMRSHGSQVKSTVVAVGAGIVGLLTAFRLTRAGYSVHLLDAGPDPRGGHDWRRYGCTRGGANARMFTLTEADNYNDQDVSAEMNLLFQRPVSEFGWRACDQQSLTRPELAWMEEHEHLSPALARSYNDDVFSFNHESRGLWEELMCEDPELFEGVEVSCGIIRLYTDEPQLRSAVQRQRRVGAFRRVLTPDNIGCLYPALADAAASGVLAGGIEVVGFTVTVHDLMANLLQELEQAGVTMSWTTRVRRLRRDDASRVTGLVLDDCVIEADHYVVAPGVYGSDILAGTATEHRIQGVLGVWLTIPNIEPKLYNSLKIARRGSIAEDANVTVARDAAGAEVLIYGSGYGYVGLTPGNLLATELGALQLAVEENVKTFFPRQYEAAVEGGHIGSDPTLCVRPWTSSGLGIFEVIPASNGLMTIVGGHNTGGFAQAPSVANAVIAAFQGVEHSMHVLYNPDRPARARPPARCI